MARKGCAVTELPENPPDKLRGYCEARGGWGQAIAVLALVEGVKPAMDDWIPMKGLDAFGRWADLTGIHWTTDACFEFVAADTVAPEVIGRDRLNTTSAIGHRPAYGARGSAHVFMSRDPERLRRTSDTGWYPVITEGRISEKPWIDHYHFGASLGYPPCCRRAFAAHNDWGSDNSLFQAIHRAKRPLALCNSLMKHAGLSYSVHLPCSFDCPMTAKQATEVRRAVYQVSPELGRHVDRLSKGPYLVISEWEAFGFAGVRTDEQTIHYDNSWVAPSNHPNLALQADLARGDQVQVRGNLIVVSRGSTLVGVHTTRVDRFGPQVPMTAEFTLEAQP